MATTLVRKRRRAALKQLKARDIMESNTRSIRRTASARSASRFLRTHGVPSAPVTDNAGRLIGIVSEADLFDSWDRRGQVADAVCNKTNAGIYQDRYFRCAELTVKQLMNLEVFSVPADASIAKVIEKFVKGETRRLFVTDQDGVLVGEIVVFDLLRTLGERIDPKLFARRRP
jgi:CBS-domain-containing membrane protein